MTFKRDMYLRGEIVRAGDYLHITAEQYRAMKEWIEHKSLKTYAMICMTCFNCHGLLWVPYKVVKVFWHTYIDGFYKTVAENEPQEEEASQCQ